MNAIRRWRCWLLRHIATVFLVLGLAFFGIFHSCASVRAHDIYKHWRVPGSAHSPCCNDKDCRPTRAYFDDAAGNWRAWNGTRWLLIPADRVLPTDYAGDGRSHLCASEQDTVFCFTPGPEMR